METTWGSAVVMTTEAWLSDVIAGTMPSNESLLNGSIVYIDDTYEYEGATNDTSPTGSVSDEGPSVSPSDPFSEFPPYFLLKVVVCIVCQLLTLFANLLVIYSYATTRSLRTYTNHYIVGLAVADLISGGLTPVLKNVQWLMGGWPFDFVTCAVTEFFLHVFLQATFMMTLVICYDRFRALRTPLRHLKEKTFRHACFMISLAYLVPVLIWAPMILILPAIGWTEWIYPPLCNGSYGHSPSLLIVAVLLLSWMPMFATIVLYAFVYSAVVRKGLNKKRYTEETSSSDRHQSDAKDRAASASSGRRQQSRRAPAHEPTGKEPHPPGDQACAEQPGAPAASFGLTNRGFEAGEASVGDAPAAEPGPAEPGPAAAKPEDHDEELPGAKAKPPPASSRPPNRSTQSSKSSSLHQSRRAKPGRSLANIRATRTLTYILITTLVSAAPWSVLALWASIDYGHFPVTDSEFKFFAWLAHISSILNPLCYAASNPTFKESFLRILRCRSSAQTQTGRGTARPAGIGARQGTRK